jgi:flagellar secretion chaperone FliS
MESKTGNNTSEYLKTRVLTASPEQLQLMLYDGAIRFCEQARQAIQNKEIEKKFHLLTRAENIVLELCKSMREELAPETCSKMRALYLFCYEKLVMANMNKELEPLDDALKVLRHMRETWVMLMEKLRAERAANLHSVEPNPPAASSVPDNPLEQPVSTICLEG